MLEAEYPDSKWLPQIFDMFQDLKRQNQDLLNKVEQLEERLEKKPLTVNVAEAAQLLGYSDEYLRKLDREGKMPKKVSKNNQRSKWNRKDIERMALSRKTGRPRNIT